MPGFEGTTRFTSPTLSRYELSRPFPQFTGITEFDRNDGRIWYNSAQLLANKRVSDGISLAGTYTWSKMIEENGGGNQIGGNNTTNPLITDVDRFVQRSPYESDRRHRVTISGVYRLPFGRDGGSGDARPRRQRAGRRLGSGRHVAVQQRPSVGPAAERVLRQGRDDSKRGLQRPVIRGVQNCVAQMSDAGVVTMLGYSVAAGCTEPNFIIRPNYTRGATQFRDDEIRRPPFYQFDMNFAKTTRMTGRRPPAVPHRGVQRAEPGRSTTSGSTRTTRPTRCSARSTGRSSVSRISRDTGRSGSSCSSEELEG